MNDYVNARRLNYGIANASAVEGLPKIIFTLIRDSIITDLLLVPMNLRHPTPQTVRRSFIASLAIIVRLYNY